MTVYGYQRISTNHRQELLRQETQLLEKGVAKENIYSDIESGRKENRNGLNKVLSLLKEGDTLIVCEFSRISRSVQQLIAIAEDLSKRNVNFISLKENIDTSTAEGKFFYTIIAAFAAFEVDMIRQRTKQGLEAARKKGRVGGRPATDKDKLATAAKLYSANEMSIKAICETVGVSKSVLYAYLKENNIER